MDKEAVVHIYNEYYSGIKRNAFEPVLMRWTNLEPITKSEICQKEKSNCCIYVYSYIWYLERQYWWNYLQGRNGDADIENRLMDTGGWEEGESGMNGENSMETYTLTYVK